ncbi:MAG TPA: winged helix-turn-helix transcriptional regulator [Dehalococcoidia bacterium]
MHSTKSEILALLKRADGATVDDLSSSLGLASMTVRQHLTALERDDLVRAEEVRRPMGRPHYQYRLTDDGHRQVSNGYDRLVTLLVEQAGMENGDAKAAEERRRELFRRAGTALGARYRTELVGLGEEARIERVVAILRSHGGFAEWHENGGGFELRDFSCVFRANIGADGRCEWHEAFLAEAIGGDIVAAPQPDGCADCCRYIIPSAGALMANRGRAGTEGIK